MAKDIKYRPSMSVRSLGAPERESKGSHRFTSKWKVPSEMYSEDREDRAQSFYVNWVLSLGGGDRLVRFVELWGRESTSSSANLNDFKVQSGKTYTRRSFYPLSDRKLKSVSVSVETRNMHGGATSKTPSATCTFDVPRAPTVSAIKMSESGDVTCTVKTDPGEDRRERHDTRYTMAVTDSKGKTRKPHDGSTTAESVNLPYDAKGYQALGAGKHMKVQVTAWARGYAGDSPKATRTFYISRPKKPQIKKVSVSGRSSRGRVTAKVKTNATTEHPVDSIELQALVNVAYSKKSEIPANADWVQVGAKDDGKCTALACDVSEVAPDPGKRTWLRLKSWHAVESALSNYSEPFRLKRLEAKAETAEDDRANVLSAEQGESDGSAVVLLAWRRKDGNTGTEVSWSQDEDAWISTDPPSAFDVDRDDGKVTHGGKSYAGSATVVVKGLDESATTYIRARRYLDGQDGGRTYGPYCDAFAFTPDNAPDSVTLIAPPFVAEGASVPFSWTASGGGEQRAWQLLDEGGRVVDEAESSAGYFELEADRAAAAAVDGVVRVRVAVSMGETWAYSDFSEVEIVAPPTLSMDPPGTLAAQPARLRFECDAAADLLVSVTSMGVSGQGPSGLVSQPEGDVAWSSRVSPEWGDGVAAVELPDGLAFHDGGRYAVEAVAVDPVTGLSSDAARGEMRVEWGHQAPSLDGCATVSPADYIDESGTRRIEARVSIARPGGAGDGDVADVYRVSRGRATLVASGLPFGSEVTDPYAPFGDGARLAYRVVARTPDGDVEWTDAEYNLPGKSMRFDWPGGSLELPYSPAVSDSFGKDVEVRRHMDGSASAHYNEGVSHDSKLTADVLVEDAETLEAVVSMARYAGDVLVRLPNGEAFEAVVQVGDMASSGGVTALSIDAEEVDLTGAFAVSIPGEDGD